MPARSRIAAFVAALALLAPPAALGQSGDGGGAGDSQYQDPFGSSTPSKATTKPQARPAPAQRQSSPQPTPDHQAPGPSATAPAAPEQGAGAQPQAQAEAAQAQGSGQQTLPRTGFDVLPVAAIGVVLLLGGIALWRRPHAAKGR